MTASYATLAQVKGRMTGDQPNMGPDFDQTLADKISEISADIDRMIRTKRGITGGWSFLADSLYEVQIVSLSGVATGGTITLTAGADTTSDLSFNVTAADLQAALCGLTAIGTAGVTVTGRPGGPWTVTWTAEGPQPLLAGTAALVPGNSLVVVQELVQGVAAVPSARSFNLRAAPWDTWIIDDCVSITQVEYFTTGSSSGAILTPGTDYLTVPMTGAPIVALTKQQGRWPPRAQIIVTGVWGYGVTVPTDVREATIIEVIRSYLGDRGGNDDTLGMTPFGQISVAKAFTSKTMQVVYDYAQGGVLRR